MSESTHPTAKRNSMMWEIDAGVSMDTRTLG